ncbi:NAD-binding protein [Mycena sanguinolenta]|uniref:NAD-binding protein n=1 Tax=Mycena sanguinolenta TaxID=230812 RepID=A0A8H7DKY4_9AGAR|nr:NAD-binding protein [Mycena sanguinolenta]
MGPLQLKYQLPLLLLFVASSFFLYFQRTSPVDTNTGTTGLPNMKVAITGSNGRVGKRVVLGALARGYHVVGIDHSALATADDRDLGANFTFLQTDLRDYDETLKAFEGCEAIIHLAAYPDPRDYKVVVHNRYSVVDGELKFNQGIHSNVVISWNILRAAAELGINRIAQASSVNAINLVYSQQPKFEFFPIDETHPTLPDEPYGLSKVIMELQADTIVRRFKDMRVASLRLHWSVPSRAFATQKANATLVKNDLWGYVQEDSAAEAFLLAITQPTDKWPSASEAFFITAPDTMHYKETSELIKEHWPDVPLKDGKKLDGNIGLFDCSKAKELLGWVHNNDAPSSSVPL